MAGSAPPARSKDPRWEFTDKVQQSDLEPTTRHVLVTLALADADLKPFVSQETLAKRTGLDRKTIEKHLAKAETAKWLSFSNRGKKGEDKKRELPRPRRDGRYACNKYELHVPREDAHHGNETPMVEKADHGNEAPMGTSSPRERNSHGNGLHHGSLTPSPWEFDALHHGNDDPINNKRENKKTSRGCARDAERRAPTRREGSAPAAGVAPGQWMTITPRQSFFWREWSDWLERQGPKGRAVLERAERTGRMLVAIDVPGLVPKGEPVPWPTVPDEDAAEELPTTGDRDDAEPARESVTVCEASP